MNVLAHRIAGTPARRLHGIRVVPPVRVHTVRVPRSVCVLTASLVATTGAMVVLQRLSERIG